MKPTMRVITLIAIFPATTALCMDTAPRFEPGEWQIEMSQEGGAVRRQII